MSTTKSSGACAAFSTLRQCHETPGSAVNADDGITAFFLETNDPEMPGLSGETAWLDGIDICPDEFRELSLFNEFLASHVQVNSTCTVQCMLLWNEWVRSFRRRMHRFPDLVHEKEFSSVVMDRFRVGIADNGFWGMVYPGIRFVP